MIILVDSKKDSSFNIQKLLADLKKIDCNVVQLNINFCYFINNLSVLSHKELIFLKKIINLEENYIKKSYTEQFIVIPRFGTISSWSSKATNILHNCGLKKIIRIEKGFVYNISFKSKKLFNSKKNKYQIFSEISELIHDEMTEIVLRNFDQAKSLFEEKFQKEIISIDLINKGKKSLQDLNDSLGLALSNDEITYLEQVFLKYNRNPTDVEIMMFAQINSEHCRHKIFNSKWEIDGIKQKHSLFSMIKNTHKINPIGTITAYNDNAAVIEGENINNFFPNQKRNYIYEKVKQISNIVIKVETHNHPTAISPFSGASTGVGGEIRDEAATGRGAKTKMGMTGFSLSNLLLEGAIRDWENKTEPLNPKNIASPLKIIIDGPLGGAAFNNEFGRPNLLGFFRTFQQKINGVNYGFHKPIMISGGLGNIFNSLEKKIELTDGILLIHLGGPGLRIGLGGGAASSLISGKNSKKLDFDSVQRSNPEMQRRSQEVINSCTYLGLENPILSIHDVGAGGLSNAFPEMANDNNIGATFNLSSIPIEDNSLSPLEIWCNESQERFVIAVNKSNLEIFKTICKRESCPFTVVGEITEEKKIKLVDKNNNTFCVDMELRDLFCDIPINPKKIKSRKKNFSKIDLTLTNLEKLIEKILKLPSVSSKSFLITIGDRTVGGLTARDQMVGPWQIPLANSAVTSMSFDEYFGEAISVGEKTPLAVIDPISSGRMAIGEAITNIACNYIEDLSNIKFSANWMAACGENEQDFELYETVKSVALDLCPKLGISIPVGKDSLSMKTKWNLEKKSQSVISPVTLIATAFAKVKDVRLSVTPQLDKNYSDTTLILIDLGKGKNRLGGSALSQVTQKLDSSTPNIDDPDDLKNFFLAIQSLIKSKKILAYHDRSDGGLFVTLCEMAFASRVGIFINIDIIITEGEHSSDWGDAKNWADQVSERRNDLTIKSLFNEELGAVIQVKSSEKTKIMDVFRNYKLSAYCHIIGKTTKNNFIEIYRDTKVIYKEKILTIQRLWTENSWIISKLRDNPYCADSEYNLLLDEDDPGINPHITFDQNEDITLPFINLSTKPKIAILREQGVNSHVETAYAMHKARFESYDVHMNDLISQKIKLSKFKGIIFVGGFSYGDVLGAGAGWSKTILNNSFLNEEFSNFFNRKDSFSLGICNGCQMLCNLKEIIPGADFWPKFKTNLSQQFEARFSMVKVTDSPSIFFKGMAGSKIPISVAHKEGHVDFSETGNIDKVSIALQFIDNYGNPTEKYPLNPNGSSKGLTGFTTFDGRSTVMMPHPERVFRTIQNSWYPEEWGEDSPWMRIFRNARIWVN